MKEQETSVTRYGVTHPFARNTVGRLARSLPILIAAALITPLAHADVVVQQPGTDYLVVEAEEFIDDDSFNDEFTGWLRIRPDDPQEIELHSSNPGTILVPPSVSNPSQGEAIIDQVGGGDFADTITYGLQFETPGSYFLYLRMSMFDLRSLVDNSYANEDSIYVPVEDLGEDPTSDELRTSRDGFVDLDELGSTPADGCRIPEFEEPWIIPDDECDADGLRADVHMEGQYHWQLANWNNGLGPVNYTVDELGVALDYTIASRERGSSLDVLVFSQSDTLTPDDLDALIATGDPLDFDGDGSLGVGDIDLLRDEIKAGTNNTSFDVTGDGTVNFDDLKFYVEDESVLHSWIGDSNMDREFNSSDLVSVFSAGQYEDGVSMNSTWATGDWNGDGDFDSGDLVAAFTSGGYEIGPPDGANAVPEPSAIALLMLSGIGIPLLSRARRRGGEDHRSGRS